MPQRAPWIDTRRPFPFAPRPDTACAHLEHVLSVTPAAQGCVTCLAEGGRWVHLRLCLECGHVGCCDSSPGRHARAHHAATGHPVMASLERGERWGYCFVDDAEL